MSLVKKGNAAPTGEPEGAGTLPGVEATESPNRDATPEERARVEQGYDPADAILCASALAALERKWARLVWRTKRLPPKLAMVVIENIIKPNVRRLDRTVDAIGMRAGVPPADLVAHCRKQAEGDTELSNLEDKAAAFGKAVIDDPYGPTALPRDVRKNLREWMEDALRVMKKHDQQDADRDLAARRAAEEAAKAETAGPATPESEAKPT